MTASPAAPVSGDATATAPPGDAVPPAFRKSPGAQLASAMSQAVADAVVPVLQAIPAAVARGVAASQRSGAPCVLRKARFHREHGDEISFALARAREAAGDSEIPDVAAFLPDRLKPDPANPVDDERLPYQHPATTMIDGTLYCDWDAV